MIAIFKTGGKQYCVESGQILKVEKLIGKKGDSLTFNQVLAISDKSKNNIGNPLLKGASIKAKIIDQIRDKKVIVFKKRRRKNYKLTQGHRQHLTVLKIESINHGGEKITDKPVTKKIVSSKDETKENQLTKEKTAKKTSKKKATIKKAEKNKDVVKKTIVKKKKSSKK